MNNNWYNQSQYWNNQGTANHNRYSRISIDDAMDIAVQQIPGEIVKIELDRDNGRLVYEVDVINMQGVKYEIEIDAQTARVIKLKRD